MQRPHLSLTSFAFIPALACGVASAAVIDDFTADTFGGYTQSRILAQAGADDEPPTGTIAPNTTTRPDKLTIDFVSPATVASGAAQQFTLLRNDATLDVGEFLAADVALQPEGGSAGTSQLFAGLALNASVDPADAAIPASGTTNARNNSFVFQVTSQFGVELRRYNASATESTVAAAATGATSADTLNLRVVRDAADAYTAFYAVNGGAFTPLGGAFALGFTPAAFGFTVGNLQDGITGDAVFDNLEITVVPEPAAFAAVAAAGLGLLARRRRRHAA